MRLTHLTLAHVRSITAAELRPGPGFNVLVGDNGAGKTSVLEALHLLANGKSFRGRVGDGLVQVGAPQLEIFARWVTQTGASRQIGLRHSGTTWTGRLDGAPTSLLSELCTALAAVTFEPGSHALIDGRSDTRRRMLDWGLFHVEPDFMDPWRRASRALKQRNALLKQRGSHIESQLDAWEAELAHSGERMTGQREAYLDQLGPRVRDWAHKLLPELGDASLRFSPGWKRQEVSLADALLLARSRDQMSGFTSVGPHRADWRLSLSARTQGEQLSRGQTKLAALAVILASGEHFAEVTGAWPLVLLDDLASELDPMHRLALLSALHEVNAQVFITGTVATDLEFPPAADVRMFHVEHGIIRASEGPSQA